MYIYIEDIRIRSVRVEFITTIATLSVALKNFAA